VATLVAIAVIAARVHQQKQFLERRGTTDAGPVTITLWHGYGTSRAPSGQVNYEAKSLTD